MHIVCNIVQQHVLLFFLNIIMAEISSRKYYNFFEQIIKNAILILMLLFLNYMKWENINMNYKEMVYISILFSHAKFFCEIAPTSNKKITYYT